MSPAGTLDLELLACPECHGSLEAQGAALRCARCAARYEHGGAAADLVPLRLRAGMNDASGDPAWARWREAIRGLEAWRRRRRARSAGPTLRSDGTTEHETRALFAAARVEGVVVDVGARNGAKRLLMPDGVRYVGVDPFPDGAPALPPGAALVRGVAEALPVRTAVADAVVSLAAFDYFVDGRAALTEMARVLRPDGRLALLVSVVPPAVARARQSRGRGARVLNSLRAARHVGLRAAAGLLESALVERDRAHTHYYTERDVRELLAARFDVTWSHALEQGSSTILYLAARPRRP